MISEKVSKLESKIIQVESRLQFLREQKGDVEKQLLQNTNKIKELEVEEILFSKATSLLQHVSSQTREQSISRIETIASQALQEILSNKNLKFKIVFENKRNIVTSEFRLWDDELQQELPLNKGEAGGVKAIVSTILRLIIIDLYRPKIEGPVILDETGVQISVEYQVRFGQFLQQYSRLTGRQIILVSHQDRVKEGADKIIRLTRSGGVSKVCG